ncbi:CopG family transcriptional regulator [Isoptericola sp. BMS4]|uniref:CopG family transcriptional regulator n=1 Tax=Isoptericola sp. BMS4 TaxID=2527875 RepID=UPI0014216225|nr:CopG family transcriptional regulator [Isoptericola sp. BMS4]
MTKDIAQVLAAEAQAVEEAEERGGQLRELSEVKVTRGHSRARVLQIRLNDDELAQLEKVADERGLPTSTVARALLLQAMDEGPTVHSEVEAAVRHALRATLRQDLLAPAS